MTKEMKNIPTIRFKDFENAWEQRRFQEITLRCSKTAMSTDKNPAVEYEDVIPEYGLLNKNIKLKNIYKKGIAFDKNKILYGKLRPYLHNWLSPKFKGVAIGDWWVLSPINVDKNFLYRIIQTQKFDEVANQSSGSKMPRADWNLVSNTKFMVPQDITEQKEIGAFFSQLDYLITLHQRKFNQLKKLKSYFLQNMFPAKAQKVPQIRFKGFSGDWEQRKLGEVFKEYSEKNHPELPPLTIIQGEGTIFRDDSDRSLQYDRSCLPNYKMVNKGDFIVHLRSFEGGLEKATTQGIISPAYHTFHGEKIDSRFYYAYFRSEKFINYDLFPYVYGIRDGKSIDIAGMKKILIPFPSQSEQKRIGDFIGSLDLFLTLYQRQLNQLQSVKKFMLQNMFI